MTPVSPADLAARIAARHRLGETLVVGITGSVAVGKTTLARQIAEALPTDLQVEIVSTDGFLKPNAVLEAQGLSMRKGFPESYDRAAMAAALAGLQHGAVTVPACREDALGRPLKPSLYPAVGTLIAPQAQS